MRRPLIALASFALLCCSPRAGRAGEALHPTAEDVVALKSAADAKLSPDGGWIAFTLGSVAFDSTAKPSEGDTKGGWKRERQLWLVDAASHATRALTTGDAAVSQPAWSPDGRSIAFLRRQGGSAKLFVLPLAGGEARVVATGKLEPEAPAWSPDGRSIAFLAEAAPGDSVEHARWARGGAIEWEHEFAGTQLWVVPAAGGEPRAVTHADNVTEFAWSPEGRRFVVTASSTGDPYQSSNLLRARIVDAASGAVVRELDREPSSIGSATWSPDGTSIALLGLNGGLSNVNALLLWNATSGAVRNLATDPDRTFTSLLWSADSRAVLAVESFRTGSRLTRFPLAGVPVTLPAPERVLDAGLSADASGKRAACLSATANAPADVSLLDPATGHVTAVTTLNPQISAWALGRTEVVKWNDAEGVALEGVLVVAPGSRPGAPAPLVVLPHGGPDAATSVRFSGLVQYLCSRGYSVFEPNYRGSTSYGFALYAANRNRFGEIEQADIESGVDALLRDGKADAKQLYFGGWSWGGYLTCWTITHVQTV